jgi:formylglycine-generating enzyme required for sulfatase activity
VPGVLDINLVPVPGGEYARLVTSWSTGRTEQIVRISPFSCQDAPVTVHAYRAYLDDIGHQPEHVVEVWDGEWHPGPTFGDANSHGDDKAVVGVSYEDALRFIDWLNHQQRGGYRLPTEAEFEYVARANCSCDGACWSARQARPSASGPRLPSGRPGGSPWPVRYGSANALAIWDLHGLIWQWCLDWYAPYPADDLVIDPRGPTSMPDTTIWNGVEHPPGHVIRGGSFSYPPSFAECYHRHYSLSEDRNVNLGFRVVRDEGDNS